MCVVPWYVGDHVNDMLMILYGISRDETVWEDFAQGRDGWNTGERSVRSPFCVLASVRRATCVRVWFSGRDTFRGCIADWIRRWCRLRTRGQCDPGETVRATVGDTLCTSIPDLLQGPFSR